MGMKYVIWGAGMRGGRLFRHLDSADVLAFLDKDNNKIGEILYNKKVISLDEYVKNYRDAIIIIAHTFEKAAVEQLEKLGIRQYMRLSDCPGEFQEENTRSYLENHVKGILNRNDKYGILGCTVYGLEVYRWLKEIHNINSYMILEKSVSSEIARLIAENGYTMIDIDKVNRQNTDCILDCKYRDALETDCVFQGIQMKSIYDCSDDIEEYYNRRIENFKNRHKGESCVIVATGPSLNVKDLDLLKKREIATFGVNKIGYAYEATSWRPTYYVGEDRALLESEYFSDIQPEKQSSYAFLGDTSPVYWKEDHEINILKYHLCDEWAFGRYPKFSEDFARKTYVGGTIVYTCIQLAVYMGFSNIILYGVDFTGAGEHGKRYQHFYKEDTLTSVSYTDQVLSAYEKARQYAEEHGIKIYNATRGGKLGVFERVDFDSLFG